MSFSSDTKKELTKSIPDKKCCQLAEIAGFMRFAGAITLTGGKLGIKVSTEDPAVARLYISLMKEYFGAKSSLSVGENGLPIRGKVYELSITPEMNADAILREVGFVGIREGSNYLTDGIDSGIIKKRCCKKACLRGVFLAAGSISDPARAKSGYHLEIKCSSEPKANDVKKLMGSFGLKAKSITRGEKEVVYLKDGEQIQDFLAAIGASNQFLLFNDTRMQREAVNQTNRGMNCDSANMDKTINAAQKQIEYIEKIRDLRGLDHLPSKLREAAELRLSNRELPLSELAELFDPPLKKSGLNHRLEKIREIAEKL